MAIPLIQDQPDENFWKESAGNFIENSYWDQIKAEFALAKGDTAMEIIGDSKEIDRLENQPGQVVLSPDELNEKYADTGITFVEPKKQAVAEEIVKRKLERDALETRVRAGPSGLFSGAAGLGAGVVAHITDPVEFGFNVLTGFGLGRAALTFGIKSAIGQTIARNVVQDIAVGSALEVGAQYRNSVENRDYSAMDSVYNVGLSAAASAGINLGTHFAGKALKRIIKDTDSGGRSSMNAAIGDVWMGKRPNVDPIEKAYLAERSGNKVGKFSDFSGRTSYQYKPLQAGDDGLVSGKFFLASKEINDNFKQLNFRDEPRIGIGYTDYGPGLYATDNALISNGISASSFNEAPGLIHEIDINKANLIDSANFLGDNKVVSALVSFAKEKDIELPSKYTSFGETVNAKHLYEYLDNVSDTAKEEFNAKLEKAGYDGILTRAGDDPTINGDHNIAFMFKDSDKIAPVKAISSDANLVPKIDKSIMDDYVGDRLSRESDLFYSKEDIAKINDLLSSKNITEDVGLMNEKFEELKSMVEDLRSTGNLDAETMAVLDYFTAKAEKSADVLDRANPTRIDAIKGEISGTKVVDAEGKPLQVYHGTSSSAPAKEGFDITKLRESAVDRSGKGFYFTSDPTIANDYTGSKFGQNKTSGNILPAYLDIKNPIYWDNHSHRPNVKFLSNLVNLFEYSDYLSLEDKLIKSMLGDHALQEIVVLRDIINYGSENVNKWWAKKIQGLTLRGKRGMAIPEAFDITDDVLKPLGFDGARGSAVNTGDADQWIVFDKSQIKSTFEQFLPPEINKGKQQPISSFEADVKRAETIIKAAFDCVGNS